MVNRTKISKEISRRIGGAAGIPAQVKGRDATTLKQVNLWKDKWEQIPGTGTGPSNPPRFRLKEKTKLPEKEKTAKPVGVGKEDVKKAKRERLAGSLGKGHPVIPVKQSDKVVNYPWDKQRAMGAGRDFPDTPVPRKQDPRTAGLYNTGGKIGHKKKTKKTYDKHHGGKLVASLYD